MSSLFILTASRTAVVRSTGASHNRWPNTSPMAGYRHNGGHDDGDLMLLPLTCVPHLGPSPIVQTYELSLARIRGSGGGGCETMAACGQ